MTSKLVTPSDSQGQWPLLLDYLALRFPHVSKLEWTSRLERGLIRSKEGASFKPQQAFLEQAEIYYQREVPNERVIPFEHSIVYQDERILIADKPHFLPTVPSGAYVQETLLFRLQRQTNNAELAPAHRLDRDTAGLVMFIKTKQFRGAYQNLFRQHAVVKTYHAIAAVPPKELRLPMTRSSHLRRAEHFMQATECFDLTPNAHTQIEVLARSEPTHRALYKLSPSTGQRHQLRVHMLGLGLPIENDAIYPVLEPEVPDTDAAWDERYKRPLQLLAKHLALIDPVSGEQRRFESPQHLRL